MKNFKHLYLATELTLITVSSACVLLVSDGFGVQTFLAVGAPFSRQVVVDPYRGVAGNWNTNSLPDNASYTDVTQFFTRTGGDGKSFISRGRSTALWDFYYTDGPCYFQGITTLYADQGQYTPLTCNPRIFFLFTPSPESINIIAPPPTFTLSSTDVGSIDTTYGMPMLEFYNEYGDLVAQTLATSVSSDGSWLQADMPDVSYCFTDSYGIAIKNTTADGTWDYFGVATIDMYGNDRPISPSSGGGECCGPGCYCY